MEVSISLHGQSKALQEPSSETTNEDLAIYAYGSKTSSRTRQGERMDQLDEAEKEAEQRGEREYGGRDLDAEEVERYALEHPAGTPQQELTGQQRGRKHEAEGQHEEQPADKYICIPPLPLGLDTGNVNVGESAPRTPDLPLPQRSQETMLDDSAIEESRPKASRTSPSASPASLYAPHFAGGVQQVENRPVDEFQWEQEVADFEGTEEMLEVDELFSDEVIDEGSTGGGAGGARKD